MSSFYRSYYPRPSKGVKLVIIRNNITITGSDKAASAIAGLL